jgi:hypothetical protein
MAVGQVCSLGLGTRSISGPNKAAEEMDGRLSAKRWRGGLGFRVGRIDGREASEAEPATNVRLGRWRVTVGK